MGKQCFTLVLLVCWTASLQGLKIEVDNSHYKKIANTSLVIRCSASDPAGYPQVDFDKKTTTSIPKTITNSTEAGRIFVVKSRTPSSTVAHAELHFVRLELDDGSLGSAAFSYDCVASFQAQRKKQQFDLSVLPADAVPVMTVSPDTSTTVDDAVTLQCNATSEFSSAALTATPTFTLSWYHSRDASAIGVQVQNTPDAATKVNTTFFIKSTLTLDPIRFPSGGYYTCQISMKLTQYVTYTFANKTFVAVEGKGSLSTQSKEMKVKAGSTVLITSPMVTDPPASSTWTKDGQEISFDSGSRFHLGNSSRQVNNVLTISDVQYTDRGVITCNSSNGYSVLITDFRLRVRDPLGAVWPFIGIIIETIILVIIIAAYERYRKSSKAKKRHGGDSSDGPLPERKETSPLLPKSGESGVAYSNMSGEPEAVHLVSANPVV